MGTVLIRLLPLQMAKIVASFIFLISGACIIVNKQPPILIRRLPIEAKDKVHLKNTLGGLIILGGVLYPIEIVISAFNLATQDFREIFWGAGLIVIASIGILILNYYSHK